MASRVRRPVPLPPPPALPPLADLEAAAGPFETWSHQCHAVSLALVRSGLFPGSRVARGVCVGVPGQHSWIVLGSDVYDPLAPIIDPTLWSYDATVKGIWVGFGRGGLHRPHGSGSIWDAGRPAPLRPEEEPYPFPNPGRLSTRAQAFLDLLGPLSRRGWAVLFNLPMGDWPSREIIDAAADDPKLEVLIPIDILGMLTDRNPSGLYLPRSPT